MYEAPSATGGPVRRGWYYGWNIVAVCILAQTAGNGLPINAFSLFLTTWSREFHTPVSGLVLGLATCGVGCALVAPVVGNLADRVPARWLFGIGMSVLAVFEFAVAHVTSSAQLVALYALVFPVALTLVTTVPANAVVSRWFVRRIGLALGLTGFGLGLSGVVIPPLAAWAAPHVGWRAVWNTAALLTLLATPVVVLVLRDRPGAREGLHFVQVPGSEGRGGGHGVSAGRPPSYGHILTRPNFWVLIATYLPILAVYGAIGQTIGPLAASRGLGQQPAALLISVYCLAQVVANLVVGAAADRLGNRIPFAALGLVTALGGVACALGTDLAGLTLGAALAGCGGGMWPLLASSFSREFQAGFGRAFGLAILFVPVGGFSTVVLAKLAEATGSYTAGLLSFAAVCAAGATLCLLFLREKPRPGAALLAPAQAQPAA